MPKTERAHVLTRMGQFKFKFNTDDLGKHIFDKVTKCLGLLEVWYFGLKCITRDGDNSWLHLGQKVVDQNIANSYKWTLDFKYYPEHVNMLVQSLSKYLLFQEMHSQVLLGEIYCPAEVAVVLCSLALQAEYGDHSPSSQSKGFLNKHQLFPHRLMDTYSMPIEELEAKVMSLYQKKSHTTRHDAMIEYLQLVQELGQFGVGHFPVKTPSGTSCSLGLDPTGVQIFSSEDLLSPKVAFHVGELKSVAFENSKVTITMFSPYDMRLVLYTAGDRAARVIFVRVIGYFDLYCRARNPDDQLKEEIATEAAKESNILPNNSASRKTKDLKMERKRSHAEIAERFKLYDKRFNEIRKEFQKAQSCTAQQLKEMHVALLHQHKTEHRHQATIKQRHMMDLQMKTVPASIPALVRSRQMVMKQQESLAQNSEKLAADSERRKSIVLETRSREDMIREQMDEFTIHEDLLVQDAGICENDECTDKSFDLEMEKADFISPWSGRIPIWNSNPALKHELDTLREYFAMKKQKATGQDIMCVKTRGMSADKYETLTYILQSSLLERLKIYDEL